MTCQEAILDILIEKDVTPKGLARLTGYGKQTCFAAIHLLRDQGHKIEKVNGRNGKYRYWGQQRHGSKDLERPVAVYLSVFSDDEHGGS